MVSGASGSGFSAVFRGLVFALFRPCGRRFRSLLLCSLRLAALSDSSRFLLGLVAVAAVSSFFFSLSFGVGPFSGCGGFVGSGFSFSVWRWVFLCPVVSCNFVRHTATTLLN